MLVRIRDTEACDPQPHLYWDTVWWNGETVAGGWGDWILAGPGDQKDSAGGLRAEAALHTATMICLFTDKRLPDGEKSPAGDDDPRGWWGDSVRLPGEPDEQLGSLLWTLERGILDAQTVLTAQDYAEECLAVLKEQGAVARTDVTVEARQQQGLLCIDVKHWSHAGEQSYDRHFDVLWQQMNVPADMNFGSAPVWA